MTDNALIRMVPEFASSVAEVAALDPNDEPAVLAVLVQEAGRFRSVGRWTPEAWAGMSEIERVAATVAADRGWRERMAVLFDGLGFEDSAAAMRVPLDDGAEMEERLMDRVARAAMAKAGREPMPTPSATAAQATGLAELLAGVRDG